MLVLEFGFMIIYLIYVVTLLVVMVSSVFVRARIIFLSFFQIYGMRVPLEVSYANACRWNI